MAASTAQYKDRQFLAVIGDEVRLSRGYGVTGTNEPQDTVTGMLLAGVGVRLP
jgi:hypothetical protein